MTKVNVLSQAKVLCDNGLSVIPIYSPSMTLPRDTDERQSGKAALVRWKPFQENRATTAEITEWWRTWPDANVGVVTGAVSGVIVLDVDGKEGEKTLKEFDLPDTWESKTGRGRHLWFAHPGEAIRGFVKALPGLDLRADGNYVVAPPSIHQSGVKYEWLRGPDDVRLAPAPRWLTDAARPATPLKPAGNSGKWAKLLMGVQEGSRHTTATQIAGHFLGLGLPEDEVRAIVLGFAACCTPPLDDRGVIQVITDLAERENRAAKAGPDFTSLFDLLDEPEEAVRWLVDERLPAGGLSILAGKPKAGKSTLARNLAVDVAQGRKWLGFGTAPGPVLYLALEEKRAEVRAHLIRLGAKREDPIYVFTDRFPRAYSWRWLRGRVERYSAALVIIDPLFRAVRVTDASDYAEITNALDPLLDVAHKTGAHIMALHHMVKGDSRSGTDGILGSTAITGAVDTVLAMDRKERSRSLRSIQRLGSDLEEVMLEFDPVTGRVISGTTKAKAEQTECEHAILRVLRTAGEAMAGGEIFTEVESRKVVKQAALQALRSSGRITREGRGRKGDPHRYSLSGSHSSNEERNTQSLTVSSKTPGMSRPLLNLRTE